MQISSSLPRSTPNRAFDLTTIENAREAYFLPGIDRFAAHVAEKASGPVEVHVEVGGQFLAYTLQPGQADGTIPVNVNGSTVEVTRKTEDNGQVTFSAQGPVIGSLNATLENREDGSKISGLVGTEDMPFSESIAFDPTFATSGNYAEVLGNFACSRMWQEVKQKGDSLKLEGALGSHWISSDIHTSANGAVLIEGSLGEIDFRQTITPRPAS